MKRLVIDSCVFFEAIRSTSRDLREWLMKNAQRSYLVEPVMLEFLAGCPNEKRQEAFEGFTDLFLSEKVKRSDLDRAKAILKRHRPSGPVAMDSIIAAMAQRLNSVVVTRDTDDFQRIGVKARQPLENI